MKIEFIGLLMAVLMCVAACSADETESELPVVRNALTLSSTAFQSTGKSDFVLLNVVSTGAWKAEIDESLKSWLTVVPDAGTGGSSAEKVKIYVKRNLESSSDVRQGIIIFRQTETDTVSANFTMTQFSEYKLTRDSVALLKIADRLDQKNWLRPWDTSMPMESWEGIYVNNIDGLNRVIGLVFDSAMNVSGVLPDELGELTALQNLQFVGEKKLTGNFPVALTNTIMEHMEIRYCNMGGLMPVHLQELSTMSVLVVSGCQYTGFEEGWSGDFPNMIGFLIPGNKFSGPLTRNIIRKMPELRLLDLRNNNFSGSVPRTLLAGLGNVYTFEMCGNQLTGDFPEELSSLQAYKNSEPQINICPQQATFGFTEGTCFAVDYVPPTEEE